MSRKYPKRLRREQAARLAAAEEFAEEWAKSELEAFGCGETKALLGILRAFGKTQAADDVFATHLTDCQYPHYHEPYGTWTFSIEAHGSEFGPDDVWDIASDGVNGEIAERRAVEWLEEQLKKRSRFYFTLSVCEVEFGAPSSMALYNWIDLRSAA
ncbi:hypothetical protein ABZ916_25835 [Streptomyces sp. NPDC046853]|uniref:hypothetical protein n=1 Tax=Streptomyces sp. NPDC046853 TaxID=3154920 RepID=UPI0033D5DAD3